MNANRILIVSILVAFSSLRCEKAAPEPVVHKQPRPTYARVPPRELSENLLRLWRGAVVIDRSGERALDESAIRAIDSVSHSLWSSPPWDRSEWIVVELPVRTKVGSVGASYPEVLVGRMPKLLSFESSIDGRNFVPLKDIQTNPQNLKPVEAVTPVEAQFIRVTMNETADGGSLIGIADLIAEGVESGQWARRSLSGTWSINGTAASFMQKGDSVSGVVQLNPPLLIQGGWDQRIIRFVWTRGAQYGVGVLSVSSSGTVLSGMVWYEIPSQEVRGEDWFGQRTEESAEPVSSTAIMGALLERFGRVSLYGLSFDEKDVLDVPASSATLDDLAARLKEGVPMQFFGFEHRWSTSEENLARSGRRLETLRAALVERGVDAARIETVPMGSQAASGEDVTNDDMRAINSRIVLALK